MRRGELAKSNKGGSRPIHRLVRWIVEPLEVRLRVLPSRLGELSLPVVAEREVRRADAQRVDVDRALPVIGMQVLIRLAFEDRLNQGPGEVEEVFDLSR